MKNEKRGGGPQWSDFSFLVKKFNICYICGQIVEKIEQYVLWLKPPPPGGGGGALTIYMLCLYSETFQASGNQTTTCIYTRDPSDS